MLYAWFTPLRWLPMRLVICVMMFSACWTSYMCRLQMPILAVPMIASENKDRSNQGACAKKVADEAGLKALLSSPDEMLHDIVLDEFSHRQKRQAEPPDGGSAGDGGKKLDEPRGTWEMYSGKPFDWSPAIRGQLLAAYAYGNMPGNLMGGIMAMKFGPRLTIFWTSLIAAIISLVSPLIANIHWGALLVSRILIGLTGGVVFPACHTLVAKWAPPKERSRFIWSLLGGTFGTILTYPMIAAIAENINWEMAWYIPSVLMLVWLVFWFAFAYDSPLEHPGITDEEKNYIIEAQAGTVRTQTPTLRETPLKSIFTSIPFISLIICHFGNMFLLFFYQNSMMLYLTKALGFQLTKGGVMASLPWLGRMVFGFFFSWIGDLIKNKEIMSVTALRKTACIFSHFLPGICLVGVGYVGCSREWANVLLVLALGFNGAASIANLSNNQDLSPNYAGFLYGIMNTVATTTGIIIPPMVEAIAGKHGNTIDRWQIVFWIGAGVCVFCMIVFVLGGSGKIQEWNEPKPKDPKSNA